MHIAYRILPGLVAILVLAAAASASTGARPRPIASYCSPSGDLCFGVIDRSGAVYLELTTYAHYFGRYRLCVRPPGPGAAGALRCGSFPIRRSGSFWRGSVRYGRNFPIVGPGVYRVSWRLGAQPLGPTLRFRLPLS